MPVKAQVFPRRGVPWNVERKRQTKNHLLRLDRVRCLECSEVYSKPLGGGTVEENPGCPSCGYVGWISLSLDRPRSGRLRSGGGPPPRRFARSD